MISHQNGFGLLQGVIVVAVLGVAGMVAMPKYQAFITKSQLTEALNIAHESRRKLEQYYMMNGSFPKTVREAEAMKTNTLTAPEYVESMAVLPFENESDVVVKVFIKEGVVENIGGVVQYIYIAGNLAGRGTGASLEWRCGAQGIDSKLLPDNCKS